MATKHTVEAGETLVQIATRYGFHSPDPLLQLADNTALFASRPDPNIVYPGDCISIPAREPRIVECSSGQEHRFRLKTFSIYFRTVLKDDNGDPCPSVRYRLAIGNEVFEGVTGPDAMVEQAIPAETQEVRVTAWIDERDGKDGFTWVVKLRGFEPVTTVWGLQARLNNLGFKSGLATGTMDDATREAIEDFQLHVGLEPTGDVDDATAGAIEKMHDR